MSDYEEKHPYRVKAFELLLGAVVSIGTTAIAALITKKLEEPKKPKKPKKQETLIDSNTLQKIVTATTIITAENGDAWANDEDLVSKWMEMVNKD